MNLLIMPFKCIWYQMNEKKPVIERVQIFPCNIYMKPNKVELNHANIIKIY